MNKKVIRISISIIISIYIFYYFILNNIEWNLFLKNFSIYNFWFLTLTFSLILTNLYFGALRWTLILKPFKKNIKIKNSFKALMISYFANLVIPINMGDLLRAYTIKKEEKIKYSTIFASIVLDRIFATLAIFIMGIFLIFIIPIPTNLLEIAQKVKIGLSFIFFILITIILLIIIIIKFQKTNFIKNKIKKKYLKIIDEFFSSIIYKRSYKEILILIIYSLIIRSLYALTTYTLVLGLGINLPFYLFLFIDILITIVVSIGQHIFGIIGTYETTLTYVLGFLGLTKEQGLFIAFLSDISYFTPIIILGLFYFIKEGINLNQFKKITNKF